MRISLLYILVASFSLLACSKDDDKPDLQDINNVVWDFRVLSEDQIIERNQIIKHPQGFPYSINEFKAYISNIEFTDSEGSVVPFSFDGRPGSEEGVYLFQLGRDEQLKGSLPPGNYTSLQFGIGLDPETNDKNPVTFANNHPMSFRTDMYWDMLKYRFFVMEAREHDPDSGPFEALVMTYHLGGDASTTNSGDSFYRTRTFDINLSVEENSEAQLTVDFISERIFSDGNQTIDVKNFFSYHSTAFMMDTGLKMMDFVAESIMIRE